jgi:hypothetical protein
LADWVGLDFPFTASLFDAPDWLAVVETKGYLLD